MYKYSIDSENKALITGYSGREKNIVIPSMLDGHPVIGIMESAFWGADELEQVVMPPSIRSLCRRAFRECAHLQRVEFSENITNLPANTFTECYMLRELKLPNCLSSCDHAAFEDSPISRIEIGSLVTQVALELLLANASTLEEIVVEEGNNVYCTDDSALYEERTQEKVLLFCYAQKYRRTSGYEKATYSILDGTAKIAKEAFKNCYNLTQVILPQSLKNIGEYAFKGTAIETFFLPSNVEEVETEAFLTGSVFLKKRRMLKQILVAMDNPFYKAKDDFLLRVREDGTYAIAVYFGDEMEVVIPEGIKEIMDGAFVKSNLRKITIPTCVEMIGKHAFDGCKKLVLVNMNDKTWYIPKTTRGMDYIVSEVREEYILCIKICEDGHRFDEERYDALFESLELVTDRVLVAVNRLKTGEGIKDAVKRKYLQYLKEHAWQSVVTVADYDELKGLDLLADFGIIGLHNVDEWIALANKEKKSALQSYLMELKNTRYGCIQTDYEL
ncbi:leucine-rich repeat domain-containing protein [Eubacterium oxidoreducens]|uniref:Leucine rich repeat-containing protein n=1 Tax=Eubacterium oxidoreducens TaxID=1732 RepID=A0A1G6BN90_EUBOX|nr:leucine-rich repeat domain-containing protein [Eubacterium oxidoreducens]SDB22116.1 Leucine rich repeat-containing protein [Eubacterium oxidoreducens]